MHIEILKEEILSDIQWVEDHDGYGSTEAMAKTNKQGLKDDLILWYLLRKFNVQEEKSSPVALAMSADASGVTLSDLLETVDEELEDSEKYFHWYEGNGEPEFLGIAKDELRHSEILIKLSRDKGAPEDDLKDRLQLHNVILAKLS